MNFSLKDILNPKSCEECKFLSFDNFDMPGCNLDAWYWDLVDHRVGRDDVNNGFDYKNLVHERCPLLRIKCENCNKKRFSDNMCEWYCDKSTAWLCNCTPCIEFEEVNNANR